MKQVTQAYLDAITQRTNFTSRANITFYPGTNEEETITINADRFTVQNNGFTDSAGASAFPLGEAICKTIQIELMNADDYFTAYDFFGAEIVLYLDLSGFNGLRIGRFTVLTPATYGETVIISAADDMWKADKPYQTYLDYSSSGHTLQEIYVEACAICEIDPGNSQFTNYNQVVLAAPSSEYTFRQVFGFIAMLAGGNARVDSNDYLQIISYRFASETSPADQTLEAWNQLSVDTDDITITGLQTIREVTTTEDSEEETTEETVVIGNYGYMIEVENPLIVGQEEAMLQLISDIIVGYPFRKFEGEYIAYPIAEFMDTVKIKDRKNREYYSIITDIDFTFGGFTAFSNSAENDIQNNSSFSSPVQQTIIALRKLVVGERTARERAIANATERINSAIQGYIYFPEEDDPYGLEPGQMLIMDAATPDAAVNVWRWNLNGLGFSSGGVNGNYATAITSDGRISADFISTGTLNADVILAGILSAGNGKTLINMGDGTFSFGDGGIDYDGDTLKIVADSIQLSGNRSLVSSDDLGEAKTELQNQIDEIDSTLEEQNGFIRIDPNVPSITLGKEGSAANVTIDSESVTIKGSDGASAVLQSTELSSAQASFKNTRMGNFIWIARTVDGVENQNLALKWVGD